MVNNGRVGEMHTDRSQLPVPDQLVDTKDSGFNEMSSCSSVVDDFLGRIPQSDRPAELISMPQPSAPPPELLHNDSGFDETPAGYQPPKKPLQATWASMSSPSPPSIFGIGLQCPALEPQEPVGHTPTDILLGSVRLLLNNTASMVRQLELLLGIAKLKVMSLFPLSTLSEKFYFVCGVSSPDLRRPPGPGSPGPFDPPPGPAAPYEAHQVELTEQIKHEVQTFYVDPHLQIELLRIGHSIKNNIWMDLQLRQITLELAQDSVARSGGIGMPCSRGGPFSEDSRNALLTLDDNHSTLGCEAASPSHPDLLERLEKTNMAELSFENAQTRLEVKFEKRHSACCVTYCFECHHNSETEMFSNYTGYARNQFLFPKVETNNPDVIALPGNTEMRYMPNVEQAFVGWRLLLEG